ncbi:MAG: metal-dependent transcriptional regulator [Actinomycetaceae bacterium]|nr:metal-dependent transcriptional regulator [Actinomycetaceae bacterium]
MTNLIDTTEMYLKTIFEMEEDGVPALRARIVERLGHSGPTVSETVARMERDGLLKVREDRVIELSKTGRATALDVIRKHRLVECLLLEKLGLDWDEVHEEACRWEHVLSRKVEERLREVLGNPQKDPYGNYIPCDRPRNSKGEVAISELGEPGDQFAATVARLGEPVQAEGGMLRKLQELNVRPDATVELAVESGGIQVIEPKTGDSCLLESALTRHLFVVDVKKK